MWRRRYHSTYYVRNQYLTIFEEIVVGLKVVTSKAHKMLGLINTYIKTYNLKNRVPLNVQQQFVLDASKVKTINASTILTSFCRTFCDQF